MLEAKTLHIAYINDHLPYVQYLIEKRANNEEKQKNHQTPLHYASAYGYLPVVQNLIRKGANIEEKDKFKKTPLHFSSYFGRNDIIKYLDSKGANKNAKNKYYTMKYDILFSSKSPILYFQRKSKLFW